MSKENPRKQQPRGNGTSIGDVTPQEIKDAILRTSPKESASGKKSTGKEKLIISPEIANLQEDDLLFHADENNYAEYEIMNKQNTEEGLFFTVNTYKPQENLLETTEETISAQQLDALLKNKNLLISKITDNFTDKEERVLRVRVLGNAERQIERKLRDLEKSEPADEQEIKRLQKNLAIIMALQNKFKGRSEEVSTSIPNTEKTIEVAKDETQEFQGEQALQKIAELFADPKFSFPVIATHGSEFRGKHAKELREEYPEGFQLTPDTDAQIALELLQESLGMTVKNTRSEKGGEVLMNQLKREKVPSQVVLVPKGKYVEGAINIDTGGKQGIVLEQKTDAKGNTINTIWVDHHGTKKELLTSATALMFKLVKQIPQLRFKIPEQEQQWQNVADFVTDIDNMTFDTKEKFIREEYARTLYGLYKNIPTQDLIRELKNNGAKKVYSKEELEKKGWLQASDREQFKVRISLGDKPGTGGIEDLKKQMAEKRFAPATPELGTYIFENYREYDKFKNKPKNPLAFVGVKASGIDSHITLQPGGGFFMSSTKDLTPVYEKLVTAIPEIKDIAVLVRGTMIAYDPRRIENAKTVTEREIMSALDLFKKFEHVKPVEKPKIEQRPVVKVKRHVPGQRQEDKPLPLHVQEFIKNAELDPKDIRFNTLNNKPVLAHFDPGVILFSEQQKRFIDIVKEVAERLNVKPNKNEKLDAFIERLSKAA